MFGNKIPTIRPQPSADFTPTDAQPQGTETLHLGVRVWQLRVADEEALSQLMRFVGTHEGVTELKPRYRYNPQKQREYRARKKAKEAEEQLSSVRHEQSESSPGVSLHDGT